jgi:RNA polymerase sigma factor (sigma-70 family)
MTLTRIQRARVENNRGLAYKVALRHTAQYPHLTDDIIGTALHALCVAAVHYDPESGFAFSTYAFTSIHRRIYQWLWMWNRPSGYRKRGDEPGPSTQSLEELGVDPPMRGLGPEEACEIRHDAEAALRRMTPREREVCRLRFWEGLKLWQIADRLGLTKQRIWQLQESGLARARAALGGSCDGFLTCSTPASTA